MMDADGSGAIDATELGAAFRLLGLRVSRREVEAMLAEVDRDGSGACGALAAGLGGCAGSWGGRVVAKCRNGEAAATGDGSPG